VTIAVVSPKGGVGKTTITALLGTLLAMTRGDRVVAIDSDPDYGTLGRSLTPGHKIFVDDLLDVLHQPALTVTMLERCLGRAPHGLLVLPAPTEPDRMQKLDQDAYRRIINRLKGLAGIILLDCGAGLNDPATKAAIEASDQLVVVSDAEPRTASMVAEAALRLSPDTSYTFVVNKAPRSGGRLDMAHLAQDVSSARAVIRIDTAPEDASRLSEGEFSWEEAPASWQVGFRELAAVLTSDWDELGLTA
jgi:MinD-like ATPase involved in chromosome partitioning or flagellar assembly